MSAGSGELALVIIASAKAENANKWSRALQKEYVIHVVADRAALERSLASLKPAILLLDRALPKLAKGGGMAGVRRLSPSTKTVLFTRNPNEKEGSSMLKVGVKGYCSSDASLSTVKRIVGLVRQGEIWVGRKVIHQLLDDLALLTKRLRRNLHVDQDARLDHLTPREREIAHQIGSGASNKEVATRLNVSEKTVKAHLTGIFRKLEVSDRLHLALLVTNADRHSP
jgi:DNA-binding NarL/FixJ family response regulator